MSIFDKWRAEVMVNDGFPLPSTPSGEPGWDYIDSYMSRTPDGEHAHSDEIGLRLGDVACQPTAWG